MTEEQTKPLTKFRQYTSVDVCATHTACEHNFRVAFRTPQTCLACERRPATHALADGPAYMLRCDECLVSNFGCPHAADVGNESEVCINCFDYLTLLNVALIDAKDARIAELERERDEARFAPLGDNHHNAAKCPYCNPEREKDIAQRASDRAEIERLRKALEDAESELEAGLLNTARAGIANALSSRGKTT